jgi:hypothetical protein
MFLRRYQGQPFAGGGLWSSNTPAASADANRNSSIALLDFNFDFLLQAWIDPTVDPCGSLPTSYKSGCSIDVRERDRPLFKPWEEAL